NNGVQLAGIVIGGYSLRALPKDRPHADTQPPYTTLDAAEGTPDREVEGADIPLFAGYRMDGHYQSRARRDA
ncbi:MAG: hypothetical protein WB525_10995, partial [Pseudolabrys sp.]